MEISTIAIVFLAVAAAAGWLWAIILRHQVRALVKVAEEISEKSLKEIEVLSAGIIEWKKRADDAGAVAAQQKNLADHRLGFITDYENERNDIWRIYRQMSLSAGAAQQWLLREYSNAIRVLNVYRTKNGERPLATDPRLQTVISEFQQTHPAADQAAVEAALAPRTKEQPELPAPVA